MSSNTAKTRALPNEIAAKLRSLRSQLTRWILVSGLSRWVFAVLLVLAADMVVDRLFKMDFAQRLIMLFVMGLMIIVGTTASWKVRTVTN